jgi:HPt (histidine-containing phosphotransfer) domain-containing protein
MGHRVPSALLRQLTLIAAELAYLEDRKVQQQDLVAAALEEFIARQRARIEQLRRERAAT